MAIDRRPSLLLQRHEVVAEHQVDRNLAEQLVLDVKVLQVDELAAIAPRQVLARARLRPAVATGLPSPPFTNMDFFSLPLKTSFSISVSYVRLAVSG